MYGAINIDYVGELQRSPEAWDALNVKGHFMVWVLVDLTNTALDTSVPVIEMTEYEAMGWKFYGVERGYLTFYENSNLPEQLDKSKIYEYPKKNKLGDIITNPKRYRYDLSEQDIEQGLAFGKVMEPHVQRTLESQTQ